MEFPNADDLKNLVAALAPGLIILGIRQRFVAGPLRPLAERAIAYAGLSAIYYAVANPLLAYCKSDFYLLPWASDALEYVLVPVLFGGVFAVGTVREWDEKLWRWLGLQPIHHVPAAWDYLFSRVGSSTFILVTLTDGSQVAGHYGDGSFASSANDERDLLIGEVWEIAKGKWTKPTSPKSILLCGRDIRSIELFHEKKDD